MNSARSKAWIAATSIGVVEGLKDQLGVCRWNSALRSIQQHAKTNLRSHQKISTVLPNQLRDKKLKQSEESLRTVMYLSCWGPNN